MNITYDAQANAVYIRFTHKAVIHTEDLDGRAGMFVDLDANGQPVGIEILNASEWIEAPDTVTFQRLTAPENMPE